MTLLQNSFETMQTYSHLLQVVGILGFLTYVTGFALVQSEKICGNGIVYPASKVLAATCVLISLVAAFNLASCLIQLSYIVIGLYGIVVRRKEMRLDKRKAPNATHSSSRHQAKDAENAASPENIVVLPSVSNQPPVEEEFDRCG